MKDSANDAPTELTIADFDNFFNELISGKYDLKHHPCWKCGCQFLPNYSLSHCDECFFSQFPQDQVKEFYRSFFLMQNQSK